MKKVFLVLSIVLGSIVAHGQGLALKSANKQDTTVAILQIIDVNARTDSTTKKQYNDPHIYWSIGLIVVEREEKEEAVVKDGVNTKQKVYAGVKSIKYLSADKKSLPDGLLVIGERLLDKEGNLIR